MIKRLLATLAMISLLFIPTLATSSVSAIDLFKDAKTSDACKTDAKSTVCSADGKDTITGTNGVLRRVANVIALIAGVASLILILISGFMFITSAGESDKIALARRALTGAIVGIVIVLMASSLLAFVIKAT